MEALKQDPSAIRISEYNLIVTHNSGQYQAFDDTCPHAGCSVNQITSDQLVCPCHGSRFDYNGKVEMGPATKNLTSKTVTVVDENTLEIEI